MPNRLVASYQVCPTSTTDPSRSFFSIPLLSPLIHHIAWEKESPRVVVEQLLQRYTCDASHGGQVCTACSPKPRRTLTRTPPGLPTPIHKGIGRVMLHKIGLSLRARSVSLEKDTACNFARSTAAEVHSLSGYDPHRQRLSE